MISPSVNKIPQVSPWLKDAFRERDHVQRTLCQEKVGKDEAVILYLLTEVARLRDELAVFKGKFGVFHDYVTRSEQLLS